MSLPSLLFALLLALLLGALYHFVRDGGAWHLLVYLAAGVVGFAIGHLIGLWRHWSAFQIGPFNLGLEVAGSLAALVIADYFLHLEPRASADDENRTQE